MPRLLCKVINMYCFLNESRIQMRLSLWGKNSVCFKEKSFYQMSVWIILQIRPRFWPHAGNFKVKGKSACGTHHPNVTLMMLSLKSTTHIHMRNFYICKKAGEAEDFKVICYSLNPLTCWKSQSCPWVRLNVQLLLSGEQQRQARMWECKNTDFTLQQSYFSIWQYSVKYRYKSNDSVNYFVPHYLFFFIICFIVHVFLCWFGSYV